MVCKRNWNDCGWALSGDKEVLDLDGQSDTSWCGYSEHLVWNNVIFKLIYENHDHVLYIYADNINDIYKALKHISVSCYDHADI